MQSSPFFDPDHLEVRQRVHAWTEANLVSNSADEKDVESAARSLVKQLGNAGFTRCAVPKPYGGTRECVQARDLCIVREELARGTALADTMFAMQALGSYPIAIFGTEKQKKHYLPPIATGTNIVAFASTDPEKKSKGISTFVLDGDTPGLLIKEKTELLSPHPMGVVEFENCVVSEDSLLGAEGQGLAIAFATLDLLRCTVGAAAVGLAQRALEEAIRYSQTRRQFGRPISEFQGIEFKLAEMATELEAAKLLVYQAAWAHDCGGVEVKQKTSMAKYYATEAAQRIVDQALQIHGGNGLIAGSIMERLYR